jgi:tetratricopeptide (TPR) repeat protein
MTSRPIPGAVLVVMLLAGAPAQAPGGETDDLRAVVGGWRSGQSDPGGLVGWSVEKARVAAAGVVRRRADTAGGWSDSEVLAAALLLTEGGQRELESGRAAGLWVDLARAVLDSVADAARRRELQRDWTLALAALYESRYDGLRSSEILDQAAKSLSGEPEVVLAAARIHEAIAARAYSGVLEVASGTVREFTRRDLAESLRLYDHALALAPARKDAALRRGRVLAMLQRRAEARAAFEALRREEPTSDVPCLAALFLGAVREQEGRAGEALACYRDALASGRSPQVARIAIARVLRATGRTAAARKVVEEMLADPPAADDAWWRYEREGLGNDSHYEARLAALWKAARE